MSVVLLDTNGNPFDNSYYDVELLPDGRTWVSILQTFLCGRIVVRDGDGEELKAQFNWEFWGKKTPLKFPAAMTAGSDIFL